MKKPDTLSIVVLDGHTLNPGDLSWDALEALGPLTVYDRTEPKQAIERAEPHPIVLTNKTELSAGIIAELPRLRYIGVLATGYNVVDIEAAHRRGIPVTNVPRYGTQSVAQMTFAHLLNLAQHVAGHARSVAQGDWAASEDFCYWRWPLVELEGLTLGLVGLGRIGRAVADIARAFGMTVIATDPTATDPPEDVTMVDLDELFASSDVVSLHCPLTDDNHGLVNAKRLARMKPGSFLVNTARGGLVDEAALAEALQNGPLAGAGLDVLNDEPPTPDSPLYRIPNCFITPHIAWATRSARARLMTTAVDNVASWLQGKPRHVITV